MADVPDGKWPFGFESPEVAEQFRRAAYHSAKVPMPLGNDIPNVITFMTAPKGETVNKVCLFFLFDEFCLCQ
jgi:hypothetical protein